MSWLERWSPWRLRRKIAAWERAATECIGDAAKEHGCSPEGLKAHARWRDFAQRDMEYVHQDRVSTLEAEGTLLRNALRYISARGYTGAASVACTALLESELPEDFGRYVHVEPPTEGEATS